MGIAFPYVGLGWHPASSVRLEGRLALEVVHAASQYRGDLVGFVKVAPSRHVRSGAGAGLGLDQVVFTSPSGEASSGVLFAP